MIISKKRSFILLKRNLTCLLISQLVLGNPSFINLCHSLSIIVDTISKVSGHIVIVVSPLTNLIQEQVIYLRNAGISSVSLSNINNDETKDVKEGKFSVVYTTPETIIKNEQWRKMLSNSVYSSKLCAIAVDEAHVIKHWGTSHNTSKTVFCECYSHLHELRALAANINVLALTATATKDTISTMMDVLLLKDPFVIYETPNKPNIAYSVHYISKDNSLECCFKWLSDELIDLGTSTTRTIIYSQTIKQCTIIYSSIKAMVGKNLYIDGKIENGNGLKCYILVPQNKIRRQFVIHFVMNCQEFVCWWQPLLSEWELTARVCIV